MHRYQGTIKDQQLSIPAPLLIKDGEYTITITKYRKPRSINQLSYLWTVPYRLIAEHTGHTTEEIHDTMKIMFLRDRMTIQNIKGELVTLPRLRSLSDVGDVDTSEMTEYIERVRAWAAMELGLDIPDPT